MQRRLIIFTGAIVGLLGVLLVLFGNPGNMGICVACFVRDTAGGLGLHRAAVVQYIRPEIIGFIAGAFIIALATGEFKVRGGSSPMLRFLIGAAVMVGALIFLGCPLRMLLRLSAGDLNAIAGIIGFTVGILVGVFFLRRGFSLGRSYSLTGLNGYALPILVAGLLVLLVTAPSFIFFSDSGPGALRAPLLISLGAGLLAGILIQRSRLCMAGGIRDLFILRDPHLLWGSITLFVIAAAANYAFGLTRIGFAEQPIAHTDGLWNFIGMTVVGLGVTLLGGCPLRQTVMAGEGDADAAMAFMGMLVGAAFAHNFGLASSPAGVTAYGKVGALLAVGFLVCLGIVAVSPKVAISAKGGRTYEQ